MTSADLGPASPVAPAPRRISRRGLLASSVAAGLGALASPASRRSEAAVADAAAGEAPPAFPRDVPLFRDAFENWAGTIRVEGMWTCVPRGAEQVVRVANWAEGAGYRLRARGRMHNWSPLTVSGADRRDSPFVLIDTSHLAEMQQVSASPPTVRVGAGAVIEDLLGFLEARGLGLVAVPAPGDLSVGGALAIDAHGTGVPADGEPRAPHGGYGSLSNLVSSLSAVVWDEGAGRYVERRFDRRHPDTKALLTHLGRAFVTEVELQVSANTNLRCVSRVDIPAAELFAAPGVAGERSLAAFVESAGRVEAIWFPFTQKPWLKVWSVEPAKPSPSRSVAGPYNYPFSDNIPKDVARLAGELVAGNRALTPTFGEVMYAVTAAGLQATGSADIWGPAKNVLLYVRPTTLRVHANGYAVLCRRTQIQRAVADFADRYASMVDAYRRRGLYPMNMPVEIRVSGLDVAEDVAVSGAEAPALSALKPRRDHPEWDVAIWFDVLSFPGTPGANTWYREMEAWLLAHFDGTWATVRPEWSKGWGYSDAGAWADEVALSQTIPDLHRAGRNRREDWDWARRTLNRYDPHRIFSNRFLDRLLP